MTDHELIAAYVLGELEGPERAAFELRLEREPELRSELDATRRLTAGLESLPADAWPGAAGESPTPAVALRPVAPTAPEPAAPAVPPTPAPAAPAPRRRWFARPAFAFAALAAALAIGGVAGGLIAGGSNSSSNRGSTIAGGSSVALKPLESGSAAAAVVHVAKDRTVELDARDLPGTGSSHYYELWLMTDAAKTVPIASFSVGGSGAAKVRVPLPANPKDFRYFDISRQAVGGGTGHSTESVLRGATG